MPIRLTDDGHRRPFKQWNIRVDGDVHGDPWKSITLRLLVSSLPRFSSLCVSDGVTFASSQVSATVATSSIQDKRTRFHSFRRPPSNAICLPLIGFCPIETPIQVAGELFVWANVWVMRSSVNSWFLRQVPSPPNWNVNVTGVVWISYWLVNSLPNSMTERFIFLIWI